MRYLPLVAIVISSFTYAGSTSDLKVKSATEQAEMVEAVKLLCGRTDIKKQCEEVLADSMGVAFNLGKIYGKAEALENLQRD